MTNTASVNQQQPELGTLPFASILEKFAENLA